MDFESLLRIILLQDYNTRVVVIGTALLGIASGLIGSFLVLRKRALLSDAISHATLPGIALAFLVMSAMGTQTKSLLGLLLGAAITGGISVILVKAIPATTRLKQDAALGIVLSVFFGIGVALMGIIVRNSGGNAAGLETFIYGKTASMIISDAILMGGSALVAIVLSVIFYKEFRLLCFDAAFAKSEGYPASALDFLMLLLVVLVTVIGLQAVGLILVVAMLVIPPAAARFWTDRFFFLLVIAATIGGVSGLIGSMLSAFFADLPAGSIIVLAAAFFFTISLIFGPSKGVLRQVLRQRSLRSRMMHQHLLRAVYEQSESDCPEGKATVPVPISHILPQRAWTSSHLMKLIRLEVKNGNISQQGEMISLTENGRMEAARLVRNHRLWEMYLITFADIAPSHVDRDADQIEHILDGDLISRLEERLNQNDHGIMPLSPHTLALAGMTKGDGDA